MAREGTRSATGNSRPRVFPTVPETTTTTTKKRATANTGAKRGPKKATATKGGKPAGVTKKAAPAKKPSAATKAKGLVKKAEDAITDTLNKKAAGTKKTKAADVTASKPATKARATGKTAAAKK
ncbi:Uncharacterized protein BP5553_01815 [Venustampulla echinocandica]|uniref:Uncharacterized protein n=1 Tax=Venustampulla echinocandica TaxID=2656787 RepID=A0A370U235_9HELO|nr:Uncharacterized protein BP5553_01815 [Venustampulla echinocandica]RDL41836.1 Uncharacterized protein BP5553_01815 [Venustampulla echinocandica]